MPSKNTPQQAGFTLIEMIGVLAIIGILSAAVAPKVIEAIRDAKVTSAISSINAARTATLQYYAKYDRVPTDLEVTALPGTAANFGDLLTDQEQTLANVTLPIGDESGGLTFAIGCDRPGDTFDAGGGAAVLPATLSATGFSFMSAGTTASRIVYFYIPRLSLQEAAALAAKINGPFPAEIQGDLAAISLSLTGGSLNDPPAGGSAYATAPISGANAWFLATANPNEFDAYVYVSHQ